MTDERKVALAEHISFIVSTGSLVAIVLCGVVTWRAALYSDSLLWGLTQMLVMWMVVRALCHLTGEVVEWRWAVTGKKP